MQWQHVAGDLSGGKVHATKTCTLEFTYGIKTKKSTILRTTQFDSIHVVPNRNNTNNFYSCQRFGT